MGLSYKDSGVDLDRYAEAMARLPALAGRTHGPRVMPLAGGFAGLFRLFGDGHSYADPVLVSGSDGVGTKLKVAQTAGRHDTVGIDLVAMCLNDCLCCGAEPLFFLDYLAIPQDDPDLVADLVKGVSEGCLRGGAALLGGETAVMPDLYAAGEYDLAGFCVGVVEKADVLDGSKIAAGDRLIAVPSTGLHSNGYSLVRKIVFDHAGLSLSDRPAGLDASVADVLLEPTRIYAEEVAKLRASDRWPDVSGIAHITGGGLEENVERLLPEGLSVRVDWDAWERPAVFRWLQDAGSVEETEMRRVFNCGVGLVVVARPAAADAVAETLGGFDVGGVTA